MEIDQVIDELVAHFGGLDTFLACTGFELSRIEALKEETASITGTERRLLETFSRARASGLLDFLLFDRIIIGLEEPERSAPAGLVALSNVYLFELLSFQTAMIETQQLVIEYYQAERAPKGTVRGEAGEPGETEE